MRNYIDANHKVNEIRLLLGDPSFTDKVIVVVEGCSDLRLFRKVLKHEKIEYVDVDGKPQVIKVMNDLLNVYPRKILAICDADFDHLFGRNYSALALYLTDTHDSEMMLVNSSAFNNFIDEFSTDNAYYELSTNLLKNTLSAAYTVGLLRWVSLENSLKLNFKGLNFSRFLTVNQSNVEIDTASLIRELLVRSPSKPKTIDEVSVNLKVAEYRNRGACELQVCCGHDVTNILSYIYRQSWASINLKINTSKIESSLRLGYLKSEFETTLLYKSVNAHLLRIGLDVST